MEVKRDLKAIYCEKNILGKSGLIHQPTVNPISYLIYHVIFYSFSKISNNKSNDDNYEGKRPVPNDIIESTDASRVDHKGGIPKMKIFGR